MEINKYINPDNYKDIIEEIKQAEMHNDVIRIINKTFPDWIKGWPDKYCEDYPQFKINWEYVCSKSKSKPLSVIIVDFIDNNNDPKFSLVKMFIELLTIFGHSIKRKEEFIGCKYCGSVIPNKKIFEELKKLKFETPDVWSSICSKCS